MLAGLLTGRATQSSIGGGSYARRTTQNGSSQNRGISAFRSQSVTFGAPNRELAEKWEGGELANRQEKMKVCLRAWKEWGTIFYVAKGLLKKRRLFPPA